MNRFRIVEDEWLLVDAENGLIVNLLACGKQVGRDLELATLGNELITDFVVGNESDHTVVDSADDEVCFQIDAIWVDKSLFIDHDAQFWGKIPVMIALLA